MGRLMELLLAERGLVPSAWHAVASQTGDRELAIDIEVRDLGHEVIDYTTTCMRRIASVDIVLASTSTLGRGE